VVEDELKGWDGVRAHEVMERNDEVGSFVFWD